jgi:hypothetical protein
VSRIGRTGGFLHQRGLTEAKERGEVGMKDIRIDGLLIGDQLQAGVEELHHGNINAKTLAQLLEWTNMRITALEQQVKELSSNFHFHEVYHD